ncbi:MAG: MlaD family protein [Bdellovibrionaceae bacterium]|nr:MlaD family protein [Pseudobdellovibrionaceae bacterium]
MKSGSKVLLFLVATLFAVVAFLFLLGVIQPFEKTYSLQVLYNFAGGIEKGSPVRVMGIKVGRVREILFDPEGRDPKTQAEVKLRLIIDVDKKAWSTIRQDSKFFINMAGVIGEKFLEITPGSLMEPEFAPGAVVRGEDPPRIDQLISQSYGLAGKALELIEKNEATVVNIIAQIDQLLKGFNKALAQLDKLSQHKDGQKILSNMVQITDDVAYFTSQLRSEKSQKTFELIHRLLYRLEDLDAKAIKKFFQEEGIKARLL